MAYYDVGSDINIENGGVFVDPDAGYAIEVYDMDNAAGVDGCNMVAKGSIYADEDMIKKALGSVGSKGKEKEILAAVSGWEPYGQKFSTLSKEKQGLILEAFYAVHSYTGFDGGPDESILIFNKQNSSPSSRKKAEEGFRGWAVSRTILTNNNNDKAIWKVLREWGVKNKGR